MRVSPYKIRRYLTLIRDKPATQAVGILQNLASPTAAEVRKILESAMANAENNHDLDPDDLYVARAYADDSATMPRWRPRARGRGVRIRKRLAHVTVVLGEMEEGEEE
jgi:large subunit ribosomal protein L22